MHRIRKWKKRLLPTRNRIRKRLKQVCTQNKKKAKNNMGIYIYIHSILTCHFLDKSIHTHVCDCKNKTIWKNNGSPRKGGTHSYVHAVPGHRAIWWESRRVKYILPHYWILKTSAYLESMQRRVKLYQILDKTKKRMCMYLRPFD